MHKRFCLLAALAATMLMMSVSMFAASAGAEGPICTIQGYVQHPLDCPPPVPGH